MGFDFKDFYETTALVDKAGGAVDERVRLARSLFAKHIKKAKSFLDIGCGMGDCTIFLAQALGATEIYGVDVAETYLVEAKQKGITVFQVDLNSEPLPLPNDSVDAIFCGDVIEHLLDPDLLLREIYRVLRPSGICVLSTPNLASWINRVTLLLFGWQPVHTGVSINFEVGRPHFVADIAGWSRGGAEWGEHLRVFTPRALTELLRLNKLKIVEQKGVRVLGNGITLRSVWLRSRSIRDQLLTSVLYCVGYPIDRATSVFPSWAHVLLVAVRKR